MVHEPPELGPEVWRLGREIFLASFAIFNLNQVLNLSQASGFGFSRRLNQTQRCRFRFRHKVGHEPNLHAHTKTNLPLIFSFSICWNSLTFCLTYDRGHQSNTFMEDCSVTTATVPSLTPPKWPHPTITWYSHTLTRYYNSCTAHLCQLPTRSS